MATSLDNLEYSGTSLNLENAKNYRGILCNLAGKIVAKKVSPNAVSEVQNLLKIHLQLWPGL